MKQDYKKVQEAKAKQFERIPKDKLIWTPDHPFFWDILHEHLPPLHSFEANKNNRMFAPNPETGLLEFIHIDDLAEYLWGGAFEEAQERCGGEIEDGC